MKRSVFSTICRFPTRPLGARGLLLLAAPWLSTGLLGQDRFGAAVSVSAPNEVLVLKPGFGRGLASLQVFQLRDGGWTRTQELWSAGSAERGESLGSSLASVAGGVLVASGDPDVQYGAYGFSRSGEGAWEAAESVRLGPAAAEGPTRVTLGTVMAILRPPARAVAAAGDVALVAVPAGNGSASGVQVFERGDDGSWELATRLEADGVGSSAGFGTSVAVQGNRAAVGAPAHGKSGTVFIFVRSAPGEWRLEAELDAGALGAGAGLGSSLTFVSVDEIAAGAPSENGSAGAVVRFVLRDGGWAEGPTLRPVEAGGGGRFGSALAATATQLWVGAPGADEARGRVDAFGRTDRGGEWHAAESMTFEVLNSGARFGAAVALSGNLAVVGSPGAEGTAGLAAVFQREGDSWSEPTWLRSSAALAPVTGGEVRCENETAAGFECDAVDLQAFLPLSAIGASPGERVSDAWGWTDPQTGREYGLIGRNAGAAIVDVTDPQNPVYLGVIPANPSGARDLKVYRDHLFFVGDGAGAHGLVVFDLTRLRDVTNPPLRFDPDVRWDGIGSAHNLIIDTEAGTAFTVSTSGDGETCGGGLLMIDIRQPLEPEFVGCFTDTEGLLFPGRTHDAQCLVYDGPDEEYRGHELCFASNETALRIVDVSDKSDPVPISAASYPGAAYIHQGWLTEDRRYFYLNDELDELVGTTDRTRTIIWDVSDLDDPVVIGEVYGPNGATDHNLYVKGDRMYQANYQAGFRVLDISDPENPREVGHFDTTPYGVNPPGFNGAWTAFPYFQSETVLVTSMLEGVFLLKPRRTELVP